MSNWSSLSEDILLLILKQTTNLSDYIHFSTACSSWRSAAKHDLHRHRYQLPGLIVSSNSHTTATATTQPSLFLPITTIHHRRHRHRHNHLPQLFVPKSTTCCGSHQGWLVTIDTIHMGMQVLNPVTGIQYPLPHLTTLSSKTSSDWPITKAVLSSTPPSSDSNCIMVLLIYGYGALALCRLGDPSWTSVDSSTTVPSDGPLGHLDSIFHHGKFYVVHSSGSLSAFEFNFNPNPILIRLTKLPNLPRLEKRYLVETGGELFQVLRLFDDNKLGYHTTGFEVYELDFIENKWVGVRNLGKFALFLGLNQSVSLSESDVPGIKGNCIYFTDDLCCTNRYIKSSGYDTGVFNLEDSTIDPLYPTNIASTKLPLPAVWVTPIPW